VTGSAPPDVGGRKTVLAWTLAVTVVVEAVTLAARAWSGQSAGEWQAAHPLPLVFRIHHLFWGAAVLAAGLALFRRSRFRPHVIGLGAGLILSDLLHHLVVSPILYGNMSWHWP
jgi:hypothetical protein